MPTVAARPRRPPAHGAQRSTLRRVERPPSLPESKRGKSGSVTIDHGKSKMGKVTFVENRKLILRTGSLKAESRFPPLGHDAGLSPYPQQFTEARRLVRIPPNGKAGLPTENAGYLPPTQAERGSCPAHRPPSRPDLPCRGRGPGSGAKGRLCPFLGGVTRQGRREDVP